MSTFAGDTARTILLGLAIYSDIKFRVCFSMSVGWSPMGTCSAKVRLAGTKVVRQGSGAADLCKSRQVDEGKVQDVRGEDFEVDRLAIDALVAPRDSCGLVLDFPLDIAEVVEPPVGDVVKLGPLVSGGLVGVPVRGTRVIIRLVAGNIDELQDEGSPRHDAAATGKEISADDIFEHRRLAGRLGPNNNLESAKTSLAPETEGG